MEKSLDLLTICRLLLKHIKFIICITIITTLGAYLITKLYVSPMYTSKAMLYVENKQSYNEALSQNDLTVAQTLAETCSIIFTSDTVMDAIASEPLIDYSAKELSEMINVASVNNTEIMAISIKCYDPDEAAYIVSTMIDTCISEYNRIIKSGTITQISQATQSTEPSSPNTPLNTVIGSLLGFIVSCAIILTKELLDTTIRASDDLTKMYNIPVFAEIIDFEISLKQNSKKGDYYDSKNFSIE